MLRGPSRRSLRSRRGRLELMNGRRAFRVPAVLVVAHPLNANRATRKLGHQCGVDRRHVRSVAAVTPLGRVEGDDANVLDRDVEGVGDAGAGLGGDRGEIRVDPAQASLTTSAPAASASRATDARQVSIEIGSVGWAARIAATRSTVRRISSAASTSSPGRGLDPADVHHVRALGDDRVARAPPPRPVVRGPAVVERVGCPVDDRHERRTHRPARPGHPVRSNPSSVRRAGVVESANQIDGKELPWRRPP